MARLTDMGRGSSRPGSPVRPAGPGSARNPAQPSLRKNPSSKSVPQRWMVLTVCLMACLGAPAVAQTDVNDIHIAPREVEKPVEKAKEIPKLDLVSTTGL